MIALGIQVVFAAVASFRGWGFVPFALMLALVAAAFLFAEGMAYAIGYGTTIGIFLTLDWALVAVLGFMAFVPKERV